MENKKIREAVRLIVCENTQLEPDKVGDDDNFYTDLGIDSLSLLEIALRIDQEFETDFPEEELVKMSSVVKAAALVSERLAVKA